MKKIKILIIFIIIINVILLAYFLLKPKKQEEYVKADISQKTAVEEERIYPENSYQFLVKYNGGTDIDKFYLKLSSLMKYLPELYSKTVDMSEQDIKDYMENERSMIINKTGITNYEEFKELISISEKFHENTYTKIQLMPESYAIEGNSCYVFMDVYFSETDFVRFKVYLGYKANEIGTVRFVYFDHENVPENDLHPDLTYHNHD